MPIFLPDKKPLQKNMGKDTHRGVNQDLISEHQADIASKDTWEGTYCELTPVFLGFCCDGFDAWFQF